MLFSAIEPHSCMTALSSVSVLASVEPAAGAQFCCAWHIIQALLRAQVEAQVQVEMKAQGLAGEREVDTHRIMQRTSCLS